jgi:DNA polymerase III subunit beta
MMFSVDKTTLKECLEKASRVSPSKAVSTVLENVKVKVKDGVVTLTGSNLEMTVESSFQVMLYENGEILLNAKLFNDIVKTLKNDDVTIEVKNNKATLKCSKTKLELVTTDPNQFPKMPEVEQGKEYGLTQKMLKRMISKTLFSVAQDETRPILTGVSFEIKEDVLNFASLDGFRLTVNSSEFKGENISAVIRGKTLNEVLKFLKNNDEKVKISFTPNHIVFDFNNTKVITTLLEGDFIAYRSIMPTTFTRKAKINLLKFQESVERAALLGSTLKLEFKEGKCLLSSTSAAGTVNEEVETEFEGTDFKIAFNPKFILEALRNMFEGDTNEEISLEFNDSVNPCVIKKVDDEHFFHMVLPIRLIESDSEAA